MLLRLTRHVMLLCGTALVAALPSAAQDPPGRRVASLVALAVDGYGRGIDSLGRIVKRTEVEKARALLREAGTVAPLVGEARGALLVQLMAELEMQVGELAAPAALAANATAVMDLLGRDASLNLPTTPPNHMAGRPLYAQLCAGCHGDTGWGDGPAAVGLDPAPTPFADPLVMMNRSPVIMYRVLSVGVHGTAKVGVSDLQPWQRWTVIAYVNTLRSSSDEVVRGHALLSEYCDQCRSGVIPVGHRFAWLAERSDAQLLDDLAAGDPRFGLATGRRIAGEEAYAVIAALRTDPQRVTAAQQAVDARRVQPETRLSGFRDGVRLLIVPLSKGLPAIVFLAIALMVLLRIDAPDRAWIVWCGVMLGIAGALGLSNPPFPFRRLIAESRISISAVVTLLGAVVVFWVGSWIVAQRGRLMTHRSFRGMRAAGRHRVRGWPMALLVAGAFFTTLLTWTSMVDVTSSSIVVGQPLTAMRITGMVVILVGFVLVWLGFRWLAWRLSVGAFLLMTTVPLYVLAVVCVGRGVHGLQDARLLRSTPLQAWPTVEVMGVYPSLASILAQAVVVAGAMLVALIAVRATTRTSHPHARTRARTPTPLG